MCYCENLKGLPHPVCECARVDLELCVCGLVSERTGRERASFGSWLFSSWGSSSHSVSRKHFYGSHVFQMHLCWFAVFPFASLAARCLSWTVRVGLNQFRNNRLSHFLETFGARVWYKEPIMSAMWRRWCIECSSLTCSCLEPSPPPHHPPPHPMSDFKML